MPYFAVIRARGPAWDWSLPMRRQANWEAHAAFMDALGDARFIVAGGPLGDEDTAARVLHVIDAPDRFEVERRFGEDPWGPKILVTESIEPWTILIGSL